MNWINFYLQTFSKLKNGKNADINSIIEKNIILVFTQFSNNFETIIIKIVMRIINGEVVSHDLSSIIVGLILIYKNTFESIFMKNFCSDKIKEERKSKYLKIFLNYVNSIVLAVSKFIGKNQVFQGDISEFRENIVKLNSI